MATQKKLRVYKKTRRGGLKLWSKANRSKSEADNRRDYNLWKDKKDENGNLMFPVYDPTTYWPGKHNRIQPIRDFFKSAKPAIELPTTPPVPSPASRPAVGDVITVLITSMNIHDVGRVEKVEGNKVILKDIYRNDKLLNNGPAKVIIDHPGVLWWHTGHDMLAVYNKALTKRAMDRW